MTRDKQIVNMRDVSSHLKTIAAIHHNVFSELVLLMKLFFVVPVSSATAERSFSAMTLHVHKNHLNCVDDSAVIKDFVACDDVRMDIFGNNG